MTQGSPSGVSGDVSRGDGSSPREVVEAFTVKGRHAEGPYGSRIPVSVFRASDGTFLLGFGSILGGEFQAWLTPAGLETVIGVCLAAKVRAEA